MPEIGTLVGHWGYLAIFVIVVLGNLGIPFPEEAILVLGGYMAWKGELWLPAVLAVGILGAVAGDCLGYWIGHRCGRPTIERYGHVIFVTPERFDMMRRFVSRHGPLGIFFARFLPGFRFMVGPLAGMASMPFRRFLIADLSGVVVFVPLMVALGYAVGVGAGDFVRRFERVFGGFEYVAFLIILFSALLILGWRAFRAKQN